MNASSTLQDPRPGATTATAQGEALTADILPVETGCMVRYRLSDLDVRTIQSQRRERNIAGSPPKVGELCSAVIVKAWGSYPDAAVNLQVFLDGPDMLYVTSRYRGEGEGQWAWH